MLRGGVHDQNNVCTRRMLPDRPSKRGEQRFQIVSGYPAIRSWKPLRRRHHMPQLVLVRVCERTVFRQDKLRQIPLQLWTTGHCCQECCMAATFSRSDAGMQLLFHVACCFQYVTPTIHHLSDQWSFVDVDGHNAFASQHTGPQPLHPHEHDSELLPTCFLLKMRSQNQVHFSIPKTNLCVLKCAYKHQK